MTDSASVELEMPANSSRAGRVPQIEWELLQTAVLFPEFLPTVLDNLWALQHYTDKHEAFHMMIMAREMKGVGVLVARMLEQLHEFGREKKSMLMGSP